MTKEQLSRGEATGRRRKLAESRRDVSGLSRKIFERIAARKRLSEIDALLTPGNPELSLVGYAERDKTRASLEIEQIWLKYKLGIVTKAEQQYCLFEKFDALEKGKPDVYKWLVDFDHGPSRAQQIRDKVIPPIRIEGYHTKR